MKKTLLKLFIPFVILCGVIAVVYPIPSYSYPSNAMVKVGIMDENYRTVEKTEVTVYGTEQMTVTDMKNKDEILSVESGKYLTIRRTDGEYILSYTDTETGETVETSLRLKDPP